MLYNSYTLELQAGNMGEVCYEISVAGFELMHMRHVARILNDMATDHTLALSQKSHDDAVRIARMLKNNELNISFEYAEKPKNRGKIKAMIKPYGEKAIRRDCGMIQYDRVVLNLARLAYFIDRM